MAILSHARAVIGHVRERTPDCLLFYSAGKDSIALLERPAGPFREVVLVHMYFVPGLARTGAYLRDAERRPGNVRVLEMPHWCLSYVRRAGLYCAPDPSVRLQKLSGATEEARARTGIGWSLFGMKKADSLNRRLMLGGYAMQAVSEKTQKAYPLSLWRNGEVLKYIRSRNLPAPIAPGPGRSNGVGFGTDCLGYLKRHRPGDCQKILDEFPMAEAVLWRHERKDQELGVKSKS